MTTSQNDLWARVERKIDELTREVGELRERLAKWPPREDIVTHELYGADKQALEARIRLLETKPTSTRDNLTMYGGCFGQLVFAGLSSIGTIIAITSLIIALTR